MLGTYGRAYRVRDGSLHTDDPRVVVVSQVAQIDAQVAVAPEQDVDQLPACGQLFVRAELDLGLAAIRTATIQDVAILQGALPSIHHPEQAPMWDIGAPYSEAACPAPLLGEDEKVLVRSRGSCCGQRQRVGSGRGISIVAGSSDNM
eukprot:15292172-Heterocapsa_arctica.AAC.1